MKTPAALPLVLVPSVSILALAAMLMPGNTQDKPKPKPAPGVVTYSEGVADILNNSCVRCHRDGQSAPFSLEGYANAKRYSDMIAVATSKKVMPPWKAQPGDVEFYDDAHLSDEQIATLAAWADAGAPRGDVSKEPKTPSFPEGWVNGKPSLVIQMPYAHQLGAEGHDEYWNFIVRPDITEPTWVSGIDVEPGNTNIVHHVLVFLDKKGQGRKLAQGKGGDGKLGYMSSGGGVGFLPDGSLGGWAPGAHGRLLPENAGFLLEPGTDLILQVHYNKSGKAESDQTKVALYFNQAQPEHEVKLAFMANPFIRIEPGKSGQKFTYTFPLPEKVRGKQLVDIMLPRGAANGDPVDYRIYSLMPHMHLLGKSMKATAELPDGTKMVLIDLRDWDFNWQLVYSPVKPIDLPGGSRIIVEAEYDNTTDNPFQPSDPPRMVTWGEETTDEMMLLVSAYSIIPRR